MTISRSRDSRFVDVIPVPRIILNKERGGCGPTVVSGNPFSSPRRSPGILYGIRVPTELPVSPDQDECVRDEARNERTSAHTLERVDIALFNPCVTAQITL